MKNLEQKRIFEEISALSNTLSATRMRIDNTFDKYVVGIGILFLAISGLAVYADISLTSPYGLIAVLFFLVILFLKLEESFNVQQRTLLNSEMHNKLIASFIDLYADYEGRKNRE